MEVVRASLSTASPEVPRHCFRNFWRNHGDTTIDATIIALETTEAVAGDIAPVLGMPAKLMIEILKKVKTVRANDEDSRGLLQEINNIQHKIRAVSKAVAEKIGQNALDPSDCVAVQTKTVQSPQLKERIDRLVADLEDIVEIVRPMQKRSWATRWLRSTQHTDCLGVMKNHLAAAFQRFHLQNNIVVEELVYDTLKLLIRANIDTDCRTM
ncbi:hypothetical protein C8Q76DRAFT_697391 [Earliella scabrosa]|nr:hypothetical protein C8Q76DRAFT_697391 [Earliella scabrosa]